MTKFQVLSFNSFQKKQALFDYNKSLWKLLVLTTLPSVDDSHLSKHFIVQNILERLAAGPVIGDGGFIFELEKRGYVKAGPWTPEATVEYPEAVKQLHREFLRAGADVMQAFTYYASEDKLVNRKV